MGARYTGHLVQVKELYEPKPPYDKYWREKAICIGKEKLFLADFTQDEIALNRTNEVRTQTICLTCPVRVHCLWDALESNEKFYMRGGMTAEQRNDIRRMLKMREDDVA